MQTPDGRKYRVRYAGHSYRDAYCKLNPRNTLVTIEAGSGQHRYVFFGIARCKLSTDVFRKKEGRELALSRAEESMKLYTDLLDIDFLLSVGGTMGFCSVKYVRSLLKHFESLDVKEQR